MTIFKAANFDTIFILLRCIKHQKATFYSSLPLQIAAPFSHPTLDRCLEEESQLKSRLAFSAVLPFFIKMFLAKSVLAISEQNHFVL